MRSRLAIVAVICLLAAISPSPAVDFGMGLRASTQGLGAEFGAGLSDRFGIRAGYYALDVSEDYEDTGITYDGDLELGGLGAVVDFHPFKGGFHLSAGWFSNENNVELAATPTTDQEIGDTIYTPTEIGTLDGGVDFDDSAPYFGIGWGRLTGSKRVAALFDLGVLKQGSGEVTLASSSGLVDPADLAAEIAEIEEDIEDYEFWPVLSIGLAIRF